MERKLEVNDLRISFRTNNGAVKAVRNISFDLDKGETLAIVGESGSGKSVTARAIMGILAGNAMVESGEIFYDGQDLLKISEDDFHKLRGNRIAMIFQDPLSSLNPITRIGKQLTEAMLLNGRANQRDAKREFNSKIGHLLTAMKSAYQADASVSSSEITREISILRRFTAKCSKMEKNYNTAVDHAQSAISDIDGALIDIILGKPSVVGNKIDRIIKHTSKSVHQFLVNKTTSLVPSTANMLKSANAQYISTGEKERVKNLLGELREQLQQALNESRPNFFRIGYYSTYGNDQIGDELDIDKLNERALEKLNTEFMDKFLVHEAAGIKHSFERSLEAKKSAVAKLDAALASFQDGSFNLSSCRKMTKDLISAVEDSIDRLSIHKDSVEYTFRSSISAALDAYLKALRLESRRHVFSKKTRILKDNVDTQLCRSNIELIISRARESFQARIDAAKTTDFTRRAVDMIDHLKEENSKMVLHISKSIARARAISLMEEVGIPEARKRYKQYPFQFSGGMRQRIVIAIALSANPDILICDEPTTALDVTIQAQILDLINKLKNERKLTVIFITHDLGVVANIADKIAVMYAGKIVEYGTTEEVFYSPAHPYTWALLSSMPDLDSKDKLESIPGTPPNMIFPPVGDAFAARNKYAMQIDFEREPPMFTISPTHGAATWLLHPDAPKVAPPKLVTDRIERMSVFGKESDNG